MTLWVFAFGAGMLATVSPCGFAMLPAFIAYYLGDQDKDAGHIPLAARLAQGLAVGAAVSAGFASVFAAAGLLVAFGLRSLIGAVPWAAVAIGAVLIALGVAMLSGRQLTLRLSNRIDPGAGRGYPRMVAFGAAYAVASLSCTLAVLLAVIAQATATENPLQLVGVFAAYGLGAATVLVALTITAALAKATIARAIRRILPYATRLGGAVLTLSGIYLVLYWLPSLTGNGRRPPVLGAASDGVTARAMAFVDGHQGLIATVAAALVAATVLAVILQRRLGAAPSEPVTDDCRDSEPGTVAAAGDCCSPPGNDAQVSPQPEERG